MKRSWPIAAALSLDMYLHCDTPIHLHPGRSGVYHIALKGLIVLINITCLQSGGFSFGTPAGGAGGGGFSFGGGAASAQPTFGSTGVCLPLVYSIHNRICVYASETKLRGYHSTQHHLVCLRG